MALNRIIELSDSESDPKDLIQGNRSIISLSSQSAYDGDVIVISSDSDDDFVQQRSTATTRQKLYVISDDSEELPPSSSPARDYALFLPSSSDDEFLKSGQVAPESSNRCMLGLSTANYAVPSRSVCSFERVYSEDSMKDGESSSPKRVSHSPVPRRRRRPKRTQAEHDAETAERKAVKDERDALSRAKKEAAQTEKAQKNQEKENAKRTKELERTGKAEHKTANKLRFDKKETLQNITLFVSFQQSRSALWALLFGNLRPYGASLVYEKSLLAPYDTIRWSTRKTKRYSIEQREWTPCEPYHEWERAALLFLNINQILDLSRRKMLEKAVQDLRHKADLHLRKDKILIMVESKAPSARRQQAVDTLTALQFTEHTHHFWITSDEDAATKLYNISADLGIKPYKLIERSHLPFCAQKKTEVGHTLTDTYAMILSQMAGFTIYDAREVMKVYPTFQELFSAYENEPDENARNILLKGIELKKRKDGTDRAKQSSIGSIKSLRAHRVIYSGDHLEIVAAGT